MRIDHDTQAGEARYFDGAAREAAFQLQAVLDAAAAGDWLNVATSADLLASYARTMTHAAIAAARQTGATWADVGEHLGVTRQAAHERFSEKR